MSPSPQPSLLRRWWKPAALTGAGGAAAATWFDEIRRYADEILALAAVPIMAAVVILFDIYLFKSRRLRREDSQQPGEKE